MSIFKFLYVVDGNEEKHIFEKLVDIFDLERLFYWFDNWCCSIWSCWYNISEYEGLSGHLRPSPPSLEFVDPMRNSSRRVNDKASSWISDWNSGLILYERTTTSIQGYLGYSNHVDLLQFDLQNPEPVEFRRLWFELYKFKNWSTIQWQVSSSRQFTNRPSSW